jgi:esterase/lipase
MGADIGRLRDTDRETWLSAVLERWADVTARYHRRVLFGYSLGAALAILASASRPADAMVLMSPLVRLADRRAFLLPVAMRFKQEMAPFGGLDFSDPRAREFFEQTMPGLDIDDPEIQSTIRQEFVMPMRLVNDCRLLGREAGRHAAFIREPVTIFQGRPDGVVGHRNARWLVDQLGGSVTYHEIDGNHLIPFDTIDSWTVLRPMLERTFSDLFDQLST